MYFKEAIILKKEQTYGSYDMYLIWGGAENLHTVFSVFLVGVLKYHSESLCSLAWVLT